MLHPLGEIPGRLSQDGQIGLVVAVFQPGREQVRLLPELLDVRDQLALELVGVSIGHPVGKAGKVCEGTIARRQRRSDRRGSVGDFGV